MAGVDLPARAARGQVASAIGIIIQINRLSDGTRRLTSITEVAGMEGDVIMLQEIFTFKQTGVAEDGKVQGYFSATGVRSRLWEKLVANGVHLPEGIFEPTRHPV